MFPARLVTSPMPGPKLTPEMARNIEIWPVDRLVPYDRNSRWISNRFPCRCGRTLRESALKRGWTVAEGCKEVGSGAVARDA